jgi:predicted transcriptional regulator
MEAALTPPKAMNMTVKLDASERLRLTTIAAAKKRSPHYLMKEAIQRYLDEEEMEQRQIALAQESINHYEKTGLHVTLGEMTTWLNAKKIDINTALPVCHS